MKSSHFVLPDHSEQLRALDAAVAAAPDFDAACRLVVARIAGILSAPAVVVESRAGRMRVISAAGPMSAVEIEILAQQLAAAPADSGGRVFERSTADRTWTCLVMHGSAKTGLLLILAGNWTAPGLLQEWAVGIGAALAGMRVSRQSLTRGMAALHTLPRRLARATEPGKMHQMIVDTCAAAVGAQKASLAIYDPERQLLSIAATYGYSAALVRHLRIRPGEGIIGAVFQTGRALRVDDVRRLPRAPAPRLRYRTTSFMSVPLTGTRQIRGVLSVSDPRGVEQFSRQHLRTLRTMASIARLGLDRVAALEHASAAAHAAAVDPLTGLFNRRYFLARLEEEVQRARRQSAPLTVMMLDVDNFKQLNDRLGHPVGDAVLRVVGDVLRRSVRLFDVCARHGGDEFAILMPGTGPDSSRQIAERIREGVEDSRPASSPWPDHLRLTTSIGIASFANMTGEELIESADRALYAAKRAGKNRVGGGTVSGVVAGGGMLT
jgi:diguanylate cyclase (GGDEF)-like protein